MPVSSLLSKKDLQLLVPLRYSIVTTAGDPRLFGIIGKDIAEHGHLIWDILCLLTGLAPFLRTTTAVATATTMTTILRLLLCVAFFFHSALALDDVVDLGYAKYRGKSIGNGVMRWAGMRFARSPSRQEGLRFAAPQDPVKEEGIVDASSVRHFLTS